MRTKREKGYAIISTLCLCLCLCSGCGVKNTPQDTTKEGAKIEARTKTVTDFSDIVPELENPVFVTKNCLYYENDNAESENETCLVQCNHAGKQQNQYSYPLNRKLQWVWDSYACYTQEQVKKDAEELYLAPLVKKGETETIQWDQAKKIAAAKDLFYDVFVWKSYVYYTDDTLYRYNWETGETESLGKKYDLCEGEFQRKGDVVYTQDGYLYMLAGWERKALYSIALDSGRVDKIGLEKEEMDSHNFFLAKGDRLFMLVNNDGENEKYLCYDKRTKTKSAVLQNDKEWKDFLKKNALWKEGMSGYIENGFTYKDRIFLFADLYWQEKEMAKEGQKRGIQVSMKKSTQILVSCPWEDVTKLTYEKAVSLQLEKRQDYVQHYWEDEYGGSLRCDYNINGGAEFWKFCENEIIISYVKKRDGDKYIKEFGLIGYDMETGEVREIPKEDILYQIFSASC